MADKLLGMLGPANNFGPLTPEQEEMLRRQAISTEGYSPLDFLGGAGMGAMAGRIGQHMAGAAGRVPWWQSLGINAGIGGVAGAGVYAGGPAYRNNENTMRDAESQPGGFYGLMARGR